MSERVAELYTDDLVNVEDVRADPDVTLGVLIVGMAQAGKTTFRNMVSREWAAVDGRPVLEFSASNGFRGLTALVLDRSDVAVHETVDENRYLDMLDGYTDNVDADEIDGILDQLYAEPLPEWRLRNTAVNTTVAITSEHPSIRHTVNAAGGRYLRRVIDDPDSAGLDRRPGLVVLDARNQEECLHKFGIANVQPAGSFVLTCPEEIVAMRRARPGASPADIAAEAERLRHRNEVDRQRPVGAMTLPEDLTTAYEAEELVLLGDSAIVRAGMQIAHEPTSGVVIPTDILTQSDEKYLTRHVMRGMVYQSVRELASARHA